MRRLLLGLRGDLRLALRPAVALILIGTALICGLTSAVTQDVSAEQLGSAKLNVEERTWMLSECGKRTAECRSEDRASTLGFLDEQRRVADRIGLLQTTSGTFAYAARFMGLGAGILVIAMFAALILGAEFSRGTAVHALAGGAAPAVLALRRMIAVFLLACVAAVAAWVGAMLAALWGRASIPLPTGGDAQPFTSLVGMLIAMFLYSGIAVAVAWFVRKTLPTLLVSVAAIGLIALSTIVGSKTPGSAIVAALDLDGRFEFEIGLLWTWPELSFFADGTSPTYLVAGPPWAVAALYVAVLALLALILLRTYAARSDVQ